MEHENITATEPNESAEELSWAGQVLEQAREARNLSQRDVARQLHLPVNLIQALEENDLEALPAQIYLVGYLRNYARLLNLPVDKLMNEAQLECQPTSSLIPENMNYQPRSRIEPVLRLILFGTLVILLLAAGGWLYIQGPAWLP